MQRGCLITLEGIEGAGKSTHVEAIRSVLDSHGIEVVTTREPGGTLLGEKLRDLLLSKEYSLSAEAELLILFAARTEHIEAVIRPALDRGQWVVSDRFTDASYAYQGGGRNCEKQLLDTLSKTVCKDVHPDLTILLDVEPEIARMRIASRSIKDRFESETDEFFESVRGAYLAMAREDPLRWRVVCASQGTSAVQDSIVSHIDEFLDRQCCRPTDIR